MSIIRKVPKGKIIVGECNKIEARDLLISSQKSKGLWITHMAKH